jgi:predicted dienelactone hydrolase
LKGAAWLAAAGAIGISVVLGLLWFEHSTEMTLPEPTGHFAVGRSTYAWMNNAQTDDLAPSREAKREVVVWIWYPASSSSSVPRADYLPSSWSAALASSSGVLMTDFLTRDLMKVHPHSSADPSISTEQDSYPVVIMRAGGSALATDLTALAEDLASHGYIVAGFDSAYRSVAVVFPDGRVVMRAAKASLDGLTLEGERLLANQLVPMWSSDAQFVVNQLDHLNAADPSGKFTGRLDLERLGMFGHSFGGATTLQFCHDDSRCKAGINLDGAPFGSVVKEGLRQPVLFLFSDHGIDSAAETGAVYGDVQSIYDRQPNGKTLLMIRGANHFTFTDQILLKSHYLIRLLQGVKGVEPRRGIAISTDYVHTFFDVYLKDAPASRLDELRQVYPEIQPVPISTRAMR